MDRCIYIWHLEARSRAIARCCPSAPRGRYVSYYLIHLSIYLSIDI